MPNGPIPASPFTRAGKEPAAAATIPTVPPTDIIPGSAEQKLQAARVSPKPPEVTVSPGRKLFEAVTAGLVGLGGLSSAGLARGKPAGQIALEQMQAFKAARDDEFSRQSFGYMVRLNADIMRNPDRASEAVSQLQDFIEQNAENLPVQLLQVANDAMSNMQQIDREQKLGKAALKYGDQFGAQFQAYAQLMDTGDFTHKEALALADKVPVRNFQPLVVKGRIKLVSNDGRIVDVGPADGEAEQMKISDIPQATRTEIHRKSATGGLTLEQIVIAHSDPNHPNHKQALSELAAAESSAERRAEEVIELRQRQRLTPKQLQIIGELTQGKARYQYFEELPDNLSGRLAREEQRIADRGLEAQNLLMGRKAAFDAQGNKVIVTSENLDEIRQGLGKTVYSVQAKDAEMVEQAGPLIEQLDYVGHLADRILAKKGGGQNLVAALRIAVNRGLMTSTDAALFDGITKAMVLQIAKLRQGARASDMDAKLAAALIPNMLDTVQTARAKLDFLSKQFRLERDARLGIPVAMRTSFNNKDALKAIPQLQEQFGMLGREPRLAPSEPTKPGPRGAWSLEPRAEEPEGVVSKVGGLAGRGVRGVGRLLGIGEE